MALDELDDPRAVLAAVDEFDRLGRDEFLGRHGFGPARRYFLEIEGRHYDLKAIAGVAYGHQFPDRGLLAASDFSGGESTVRRKLQQLGFTVVRIDADLQLAAGRYWIFVCNPRKWAIDRFLAERVEHDTWGVRPSDARHFAPGQLALICVGVDRRSGAERPGEPLEAGIYALCEIESAAYPGRGSSDRFWAPGKARGEGWPTVDIRYARVYAEHPLAIARLKAERPDLSPLLLNGLQASSFPISTADFHAVLALLGEDPTALPAPAVPPPRSLADLAELERRYLNAAPEVKQRLARTIERGPIGDLVKQRNGYRCQICDALGRPAIGFHKPDGNPYVEAHHVMPVARHEIGSLASANIITVCPNHHRQLHYGGIAVTISDEAFEFGLPEQKISVMKAKLS